VASPSRGKSRSWRNDAILYGFVDEEYDAAAHRPVSMESKWGDGILL
jgi:hypothetical protein